MKQTINCILHPDKPATSWSGYVTDPKTKQQIIAGFCNSKECHDTLSSYANGSFKDWTKEMGKQTMKL